MSDLHYMQTHYPSVKTCKVNSLSDEVLYDCRLYGNVLSESVNVILPSELILTTPWSSPCPFIITGCGPPWRCRAGETGLWARTNFDPGRPL